MESAAMPGGTAAQGPLCGRLPRHAVVIVPAEQEWQRLNLLFPYSLEFFRIQAKCFDDGGCHLLIGDSGLYDGVFERGIRDQQCRVDVVFVESAML